ncbi:hypothetical protein GN156_09770 [bacterium LRH843]|nr:hypothetical protein [bacterium LRH843]
MIIFGLETIIQSFLKEPEPRQSFGTWLELWLDWEKESEGSTLFLIGTDIGKGIVPLEKEARLFRDIVGWCFQDVAKKAERVDVIWYGLHEQLK